MGRVWKPKECDVLILKLLYDFKFLRAKTLVKATGLPEKRGYERLREMTRQGFLLNKPYIREIELKDGRILKQKAGVLYYLTRKGQLIYKELAGLEITGAERVRTPDEDKIGISFKVSVLLENLLSYYPLDKIIAGRFIFPEELKGIFIYPVFSFGDEIVVYYKPSELSPPLSAIITACQETRLTPKGQDIEDIIILVDDKSQKKKAHEVWRERYGENERILLIDDMENIRHVLDRGKGLEQAVKDVFPDAQRIDSYTYQTAGTVIYDLIGLPKDTVYQMLSAGGDSIKIGVVGGSEEKRILEKVYSEIEEKQEEIELTTIEELKQRKITQPQSNWLEVLQKIRP